MRTHFQEHLPIYQETQRISQWWVWGILALIDGMAIVATVCQIFMDIPVGDHPMPDEGLLTLLLLVSCLTAFVAYIRLETWITTDALYVRFRPFHQRIHRIPLTDIAEIYLRTYRPLAEFGGWGYRYSFTGAGIAWNISGNQGIQVMLKSGRKILVGTTDPIGVAAALTRLG